GAWAQTKQSAVRVSSSWGLLSVDSGQHAGDDAVAAMAGKAESVLARDIHLLRECLPEEAAGAEEARAHRRRRDAEHGGGLLDGELLNAAQHEDGAIAVRQRVDLRFEQPPHLLALRVDVRRVVHVGV